MTAGELYSQSIARCAGMTASFVADFSDADFFVRPVPGANHAAWQLGHVTAGARRMGKMAGLEINLSDDFVQKFSKDAVKIDDPAAFPPPAEIVKTFKDVYAQVQAGVARLTEADFAKPTGMEFAPTIADMITILTLHPMMHAGQYSIIRRKLGKPNIL